MRREEKRREEGEGRASYEHIIIQLITILRLLFLKNQKKVRRGL